jgi:hypothetical protein
MPAVAEAALYRSYYGGAEACWDAWVSGLTPMATPALLGMLRTFHMQQPATDPTYGAV